MRETHGTKAGEGVIGSVAAEQERDLCECDACTHRRIMYCREAEATGPRLPYMNAPSSYRLH